LEELAVTPMTSVEINGMTGEKALHYRDDGGGAGP